MLKFLNRKPNQTDTEFVRKVKFLIRKGEAIAGARFVGLNEDQIHFGSSFYDRRKFDKSSSYEDDIQQTIELLRKVKPHQVLQQEILKIRTEPTKYALILFWKL